MVRHKEGNVITYGHTAGPLVVVILRPYHHRIAVDRDAPAEPVFHSAVVGSQLGNLRPAAGEVAGRVAREHVRSLNMFVTGSEQSRVSCKWTFKEPHDVRGFDPWRQPRLVHPIGRGGTKAFLRNCLGYREPWGDVASRQKIQLREFVG